jgi:hypothetical protein
MKDLLVLVADKNMEFLLKGLLPKISKIEKIEPFSFDINVHPYRDPGVFTDSHEFLRGLNSDYSYLLVILDHDGSGQESLTREEIEISIESNLSKNGWGNRHSVICIDPELEQWIWVNETHIHKAISWERSESVYEWLHNNSLKIPTDFKPKNPKEAFEQALVICKTARSSSIYQEISSNASYKMCTDPAFLKMIGSIMEWFSTK